MTQPRRGRKITGSALFWYLKRNGPSSEGELDREINRTTIQLKERALYNIQKFGLHYGKGAFARTVRVFYLAGYHHRAAVVIRWLDSNRDVLEGEISKSAFTRHIPRQFADAWEQAKQDFPERVAWLTDAPPRQPPEDREHTPTGSTDMTCPRCGDDDIHNLPTHINSDDCDPDDNGGEVA